MIGVIDYGSGNINAIVNIYERLNIPVSVIYSARDLNHVSGVVLPGVGAFDDAMIRLNNSGIREALDDCVLNARLPVLGICVGMQLMAEHSEEGTERGLGWFEDSSVVKIDEALIQSKTKLPHMGWNSIYPVMEHPIFDDLDFEKGFYFLHSYKFVGPKKFDLSQTYYGEKFSSAVNVGNIFGFQFHPEKSHGNGISIFRNFARYVDAQI